MLYSPGSANPWQALHVNGWNAEDNVDVTSAVILNENLVALGTAKHGVALIDLHGNAVQRLGTAEGLADLHVYSLAYDHSGGLWLALDNGVSLVSLNLPKDSSAAPFNAWVRGVEGTRDDRLLFGGTYFAAPGGVPQLMQGEEQRLKFTHTYNEFRFDYSANGVSASGDMQFQTYMRGVDADWTSWSTRSEREFTELKCRSLGFQSSRAQAQRGSLRRKRIRIHHPSGMVCTWWFRFSRYSLSWAFCSSPSFPPERIHSGSPRPHLQ